MSKKTKLSNKEINSFLSAKCSVTGFENKTNLCCIQDVLIVLIEQSDDSSGKRPFGFSDCKSELKYGLIKTVPRLEVNFEHEYDLDDCFKQIFKSLTGPSSWWQLPAVPIQNVGKNSNGNIQIIN